MPSMKREAKGYTLSNVTVAMDDAVVDVYVIGPEYARKQKFVLRNPDINFEAVIEICHPPHDEFVYDSNHDTCLLLDTHETLDMELDHLELKGACLKVCQATNSPSGVRCVELLYNCPVRVYVRLFQNTLAPSSDTLPVLEASLLKHFELTVQYDDSQLKVKLPITREPTHLEMYQPFFLLKYPIILLSGILEVVAIVLIILIAKDTFAKSSAMTRTAMVLICCRLLPHHWGILPNLHLLFLKILPIPLFLAARAREHHFSRLDKFYIAMDIGAILASFCGICVLYCIWTPLAYRAYLGSLGSHWPTSLMSTSFVRRMQAFEERISRIRFVREIFGCGFLEENGLRGRTNIDAIHKFTWNMCEGTWWWLRLWYQDHNFLAVVETVMEYGREKT
ncbi:uncharacterized protein BDZ99DRAFT_515904 [Mytilinidion resinicola]|uniref:Uncharacterized protein n=1 Tax=Mytilinidion resinicola TaxID=574789 RepID=A0A6A6Z4E3_9PEZI|nr:uncharacterized protein BDZ99DRAFT_515904 [Mytilinidion resinicola]KAF2815154.1 hypothetical protein BDZ99DRAFT_515904 [Mytilinidion resinicola]